MMLLPVQTASGRARKENSWVLQITHSSAQPERCSAIRVRTKTDSIAQSRGNYQKLSARRRYDIGVTPLVPFMTGCQWPVAFRTYSPFSKTASGG